MKCCFISKLANFVLNGKHCTFESLLQNRKCERAILINLNRNSKVRKLNKIFIFFFSIYKYMKIIYCVFYSMLR